MSAANNSQASNAKQVAAIVEELKDKPGALLPILHSIQDQLTYIPGEVIPIIAEGLNLSSKRAIPIPTNTAPRIVGYRVASRAGRPSSADTSSGNSSSANPSRRLPTPSNSKSLRFMISRSLLTLMDEPNGLRFRCAAVTVTSAQRVPTVPSASAEIAC